MLPLVVCKGRDAFFFNDTATTEIYTLSLHDALPIFRQGTCGVGERCTRGSGRRRYRRRANRSARDGLDRRLDRKSTRLNSSHANILHAVFCLKKKLLEVEIGQYLRFNGA